MCKEFILKKIKQICKILMVCAYECQPGPQTLPHSTHAKTEKTKLINNVLINGNY